MIRDVAITVETEGIRDESYRRPHQCGACGSREIRVWAMVYDALTIKIKERMAANG